MSLPENWATAEDFATLFQYFWHRDFPIDQIATGAKRTDWTIHIGVVVRSIADLMGLVTRFERRGRRDAVLRSTAGDEIAIEWEWDGVKGNELDKLKNHEVWSKDKSKDRLLKYAVFISYENTTSIEEAYNYISHIWEDSKWSLLLILIDSVESKAYSSKREFKNLNMSIFYKDKQKVLRSAPAFPWQVEGTRWFNQTF